MAATWKKETGTRYMKRFSLMKNIFERRRLDETAALQQNVDGRRYKEPRKPADRKSGSRSERREGDRPGVEESRSKQPIPSTYDGRIKRISNNNQSILYLRALSLLCLTLAS